MPSEINLNPVKKQVIHSQKTNRIPVFDSVRGYFREGREIYPNAGFHDKNHIQSTLDKVENSGGKIILPKTEISPEIGFFALFIDTDGNKLGLHSKN